jgi:uncharacterized damage-inducible protein DinB
MIPHLRRLLLHDAWANRETLESLRPAPPPRSLRWMAHIIGAECLWMARLRREYAPMAVWPEFDLEDCRQHLAALSRRWPEYLDDHADSLAESVSYTNSKGEPWTSTVEEILTHVTIHSAYHRGQIAADVRAAGMVPAYTDYIHAVRQGYVQ